MKKFFTWIFLAFANLVFSQNVFVSAGTYVTLASDVVVKTGGLNIASGASVKLESNSKLELFSDLSNSGTMICQNNSTVEFVGGFQTIDGNVNFYNLTKSGGGSITLNSPITVSGVLSLISGKIYLGSSDLTILGSIGTFSTTNSIVQNGTGKLIRYVSGTGDFIFPITVTSGNVEYYRGVKITFTTAPSSPGTLDIYFVSTPPGTNGLPLNDNGTQIVSAWSGGYWIISSGGGLSGGVYDIEIWAHGFSGTSDPSRLRVLKRQTGNPWTLEGTHQPGGGTPTEVIVRRTGLSGFSEFGIGGTPFDFISAELKVGFAVSDLFVETNSTGNIAYVKLEWNDGNVGKTHGVWSFSFDVTSSVLTITDVTLADAVSNAFTINKTSISGGFRALIYGNSPSIILKDVGNGPGAYIVARVHFNAPNSDGDYNNAITLTNNAISDAVIKDAALLTSSTMPAGNGIVNLNIHSSSLFIEQPPTFTPAGYTDNRKYGDINWDGDIDIADITGLADVIIENYLAVTVQDPNGNRPFYEGDGYNGTNADNADRTSADVYGQGGNPDNMLELMDLATLQDAVIEAIWPSYALSNLVGKPAFYISNTDTNAGINNSDEIKKSADLNLHVDFEVFEPGDKDSKIRITLTNSVEVKGIQIVLKAEPFSGIETNKFNIWTSPNISGFKFTWKKNQFQNLVFLIYSDAGKTIKIGNKQSILTIALPYITVEQIASAQPRIKLSVENFSYVPTFDVKRADITEIPKDYFLYQNFPNPFNLKTQIKFDIPEYSSVKIIVWNMLGQKVRELVNGILDPNRYTITWDGTDDSGANVASGVYFYTIYARSLVDKDREFTQTRKMILIK